MGSMHKLGDIVSDWITYGLMLALLDGLFRPTYDYATLAIMDARVRHLTSGYPAPELGRDGPL